jgi:hypothetical protein
VIEELLATEWVYVNDLKTLVSVHNWCLCLQRMKHVVKLHFFTIIGFVQVFYYPLKRAEQEGKEILPAEEITTIFSVLLLLFKLNISLFILLNYSFQFSHSKQIHLDQVIVCTK